MALTLEDLPAIDGLTHLTLDEFAAKLGIDVRSANWEGLTKGQKYNVLVIELTPESGDPLDEETPAAEEEIEKVLTASIPVIKLEDAQQVYNDTFVLSLIDNETKYELRFKNGIGGAFVFRADELADLKALFLA